MSTTPTPPNQDGSVNYSVKELLGRVDLKIDGLYDKLDTKTDQSEFVLLKADVEDLKTFKAKAYGAIAVVGLLASAGLFHIL